MALFLVRHASARDRSRWSSDDLERPLDDRGHIQAAAITTHFATNRVRAVWSSLATRCIDTVVGVAESHGVELENRIELTEGSRANGWVELLREEATGHDDLVMCSHGDLIPEVLNRLLGEGLAIAGPRGCEKGSVWALETRGRNITRGTYTAAP